MNLKNHIRKFVLTGALAVIGASVCAQTIEYDVTVLPQVPGSIATLVRGMNNHGELVGYSQFNPANPYYLRGWKWSAADGLVMLPAPPGKDEFRYSTSDINDAGVIVGQGGSGSGEAWYYQNGVYTLLGSIEDDPLSTGTSINESLDVVGFSGNQSIGHAKHAYRFKFGESMEFLFYGKSTAINESGWVSGYREWASGGGWLAARISPTNEVEWLGVLPGYNDSFGYGINQFGQVVGTSRKSDSSTAFVWTEGIGMVALPTVSRWNGAGEINSMGTIIGNGGDPKQGYVWTASTGSRLLTDLIDPALRIEVDTAVDLNEFGQIAANGWDIANSVYVRLLLTPRTVEMPPASYGVARGALMEGSLQKLMASDDQSLVVRAGITLFSGEAPIQLELNSTAITETPSELRFKLEARANTPNLAQKIEMYNYVTSQYEEVDFWIAGPTDTIVEVVISTNPERFIKPGTKEMKSKVSYYAVGITLFWPWSAFIDQATWTIVP